MDVAHLSRVKVIEQPQKERLDLRARWTDVRTIETIVKHGENIVSKGTYEVSADGQSLVVSTTEQRVVFKRV